MRSAYPAQGRQWHRCKRCPRTLSPMKRYRRRLLETSEWCPESAELPSAEQDATRKKETKMSHQTGRTPHTGEPTSGRCSTMCTSGDVRRTGKDWGMPEGVMGDQPTPATTSKWECGPSAGVSTTACRRGVDGEEKERACTSGDERRVAAARGPLMARSAGSTIGALPGPAWWPL